MSESASIRCRRRARRTYARAGQRRLLAQAPGPRPAVATHFKKSLLRERIKGGLNPLISSICVGQDSTRRAILVPLVDFLILLPNVAVPRGRFAAQGRLKTAGFEAPPVAQVGCQVFEAPAAVPSRPSETGVSAFLVLLRLLANRVGQVGRAGDGS